jgi:hypothetical protein
MAEIRNVAYANSSLGTMARIGGVRPMNIGRTFQWLLRDARTGFPVVLLCFGIAGVIPYIVITTVARDFYWVMFVYVAAFIIYSPFFIYGLVCRFWRSVASEYLDPTNLFGWRSDGRDGDGDGR